MARTATSPAGPQGLAPLLPTLPARRHRHRLLLLVGLPVRLSSPLLVMLSALFLSTYLFLCSLPSCQHAAETLPTGGGSEGGGSGAAAAAGGGGGGGGIGVTGAVDEGRVTGRRVGAASGAGGAGSEGRAAMAWSAAAAAGDEDEEDSIQAPPLSRRGYASQSSGGGGGGGRRGEGGDGGGEGLARGSKTPHAARAHGSAKTRERGSGLRALQEMSENNEDDGGAAAGIQHNEKTKRNVDDDVDVDDDVADWDNADLGKEDADELERRDGGQAEESELGIPCCKRLPQALIIGVKKGGTRALLEALRLHPAVRALGAEAHFFDRNYERGLEWYRGLMPPTEPGQITMEKTPSYFVTREAPARIRAMGGGRTKLLVVVRDPVTRAVSDYAQTLAKRPRGTPPFRRLAFRNGSAAAAPAVEPRWSALRIGLYARHLERWLRHFPRESMLFVSGERLATRPAAELARVQDFLGIARLVTRRHFYFNATKGFPCLRRGGIAAAAGAGAGAAAAATDGLSVGDRGARLRGSGSARKVGRRIARMRGRGGSWTYGDVGDVDVDVGNVGDEEVKQNERKDEEEDEEDEVEHRDSGEEDGDAEAVEDDEYDERGEWAGGDGEENHWGQPHCLGNSKGRPHPHIEPELLQRLREFYRPFNLKFYQMVGQDFGWD
ncbi:uncharacterized protein LOC133353568 [Lethenteron reissneri]|uniref:uncharacterized protein LOC133353568 n=1 Tax=Lethenteron reissneri TaxID=7753 RepID=UPI002AB6DD3D|nr:uncharacterized protein LOC133353568 [Lethenteron reissneri]XP_061425886.1 uncharacterized protein LOC133353568 [Lethenteron reissneri]